jgi:segregation and condensation protein B
MAASFDRELADLVPEQRWREWLRRLEAVLFASGQLIGREALARVVGQEVALDLLIADLAAELVARPYELARTPTGWMLRTRPAYGAVIRAAADTGAQALELRAADITLLAAIAYHQPVTRAELAPLLGRPPAREGIARLLARGLIAPGPRAPQSSAPRTYVTTEGFLLVFDLLSLADLPHPDEPQEGDGFPP